MYSRKKKGFVMIRETGSYMSNSVILAVSKIPFISRAYTKKEIGGILIKLVVGCVPLSNMFLLNELFFNTKYHYVRLHYKNHIQDKLWELRRDI